MLQISWLLLLLESSQVSWKVLLYLFPSFEQRMDPLLRVYLTQVGAAWAVELSHSSKIQFHLKPMLTLSSLQVPTAVVPRLTLMTQWRLS